MRIVHTVRQRRMRRVRVRSYTKLLPPVDVVVSNVGIILSVIRMACQIGNHGHCLDSDNALECKVGLVTTPASGKH